MHDVVNTLITAVAIPVLVLTGRLCVLGHASNIAVSE